MGRSAVQHRAKYFIYCFPHTSVGIFKPMAKHTAKVLFPYMVYKYVLPICHWTWHYITIANSWVFHLQLLSTHLLTHTYLLTIIIVIYLVHSLFLSIDHHLSGTYNYLLPYIFCVLTTNPVIFFYLVYRL